MARKRKLTNPLALAVLATLHSGPMHPYQIARLLRHRGKDDVIKIRYGSLYTVVQDLEQRGFVAAEGTERAGHRPERTVYRLTEDGAEELAERLRELISEPAKEYPVFAAALSLIASLHPDELAGLLAERLQALELDIVGAGAVLEHAASHQLPRLFMLEAEYVLAMKRAEADWVRGLRQELQDGTFADLKLWRGVHENGAFPPELQDTDWAQADRAILSIGEGRPPEDRPREAP
ncbi:MAG TPA: PadR family transcriptional regulator [Streptosporangiaceae bacterium]|jgi:DNA-binding PadR family transcriptional regulator